MGGSQDFEEQIASQLAAAGFEFDRGPAMGGLQPDFLIHGPQGEQVVVEAKTWSTTGGNTARALDQVHHYLEATGADRAFFVLPDVHREFREQGVVSPATLVELLSSYFAGPSRRPKKSPPSRSSDRVIFAAMPFARKYDDTYLVAMSHAAKSVKAVCKRVDRTEFTGDILQEVRRLIAESIAVIVDLSESKPNVLYEAGYAHALNKPAVHICSSSLDKLPFDVRNWNTISYTLGQTSSLRRPLTRRLKAVIN